MSGDAAADFVGAPTWAGRAGRAGGPSVPGSGKRAAMAVYRSPTQTDLTWVIASTTAKPISRP
jgi:hypothetical protein